ncbi:MAG: hypothetical protein GEU86_21705 [Actinophytocola sp.]|nr:hypothetical protein [Actinophytocola sp.]
MIERDRELLARISRVNSTLGSAVVELLNNLEDGVLPAKHLRAIGACLAQMSRDVIARADDIDGRIPDRPPPQVIDGTVL